METLAQGRADKAKQLKLLLQARLRKEAHDRIYATAGARKCSVGDVVSDLAEMHLPAVVAGPEPR